MSRFASLLKRERAQAGLSQKELAQQIGVDKSYISRIERGTSPPPSRDKVLAMAKALGITEQQQRLQFMMLAGYFVQENYLVEDGVVVDLSGANAFSKVMAGYNPDLDEEELIQNLRKIFWLAEEKEANRDEMIQLIRSFFEWLEFRLDSHSSRENRT